MSRGDEVLRNVYNEIGKSITTMNEDYIGRQSLNSLAGERLVEMRNIHIAEQFVYSPDISNYTFGVVTTGGVVLEDSQLKVKSGTATDGSVYIQTKRYIRSMPGFDVIGMFTVTFTEPKPNAYQYIGFFDDESGIFIGFEGEHFKLFVRKGTEDLKFDLDEGSLDFENGNLFRLNYGCLGFSPIVLEVLDRTGSWKELLTLNYPNTKLSNTYLPFRVEVGNTGNDTDIIVSVGRVHASSLGGKNVIITERYGSVNTGPVNVSSGSTALLGLRNKDEFSGKPNRLAAKLREIKGIADLSKISTLKIIKNPILQSGTWEGASIIEYSKDLSIDLNSGTLIFELTFDKSGTTFKDFGEKELLLFPNDLLAFVLETSGNGDFGLFVDYFELF